MKKEFELMMEIFDELQEEIELIPIDLYDQSAKRMLIEPFITENSTEFFHAFN